MRFSLRLNLILGLLLCFVACSDSDKTAGGGTEDTNGVFAPGDKTISGVGQKGPFVNGSSITMQELDAKSLGQTGKSFEGKIRNDQGEFFIQAKSLEYPYALLKAIGFYKNEVTGEKSASQLTLYALTDLSDRSLVNINLLTHLEYERSLYLALHDTLSLSVAKSKAKNEVLNAFFIDSDDVSSEDLNIFEKGEENAALLAISIMMQSDLREASFSERLANFASDIEEDGLWNDSLTMVEIADWSCNQSLSGGLVSIRKNIIDWGVEYIPYFEKYVKLFWWNVFGLDVCEKSRHGDVLRNQNKKSTYADYYFICRDDEWQIASVIEKDTYKWNNGDDGDSKNGSVVVENCYVYEKTAWRSGNTSDCSLGLNGCTANRQNVVGFGSDKVWYTCDEKTWRKSTNIEMDTATWGKGADGEVRAGQINTSIYYIYESSTKVWREASVIEKDTYDFENNRAWSAGTDGEIRNGSITNAGYVFDVANWRALDVVEGLLGICLDAIQDSVGKVGLKYYICNSRKWETASTLQYDTYRWTVDTIDGAWKKGNVNKKNYYVYDKNEQGWRISTSVFDYTLEHDGCTINRNKEKINVYDEEKEADHYYVCYNKKWYDGYIWTWDLHKDVYLNPDVEYGTMTDERDGKIYKTVQIGTQVWMAENLNYADSIKTPGLKGKSWCYEDSICENVTGRYYLWSAAIDSLSIYEKLSVKCGYGKECSLTSPVQGLCPKGWMLPSKDDWNALLLTFGKENMNSQLKTSIGWKWDSSSLRDGNGKNISGFSAIPGGGWYKGGSFYGMGEYTGFWSYDDADNAKAWGLYIDKLNGDIWGVTDFSKGTGFPIRCIKD